MPSRSSSRSSWTAKSPRCVRSRPATVRPKASSSSRSPRPSTPEAIVQAGAAWWPLQFARELDDLILNLRTNELEIGTWVLKTRGDAHRVMHMDDVLEKH